MCNCGKDGLKIENQKLYSFDDEWWEIKDALFCPFCGENLQPERSKREDHILIYKDEKGTKTPVRHLFNPKYGYGALNSMET